MPADFVACYKGGGHTKRFSGPDKKKGLKANEWVNVCWDSKGSHRGHTHKKKTSKWIKDAK